MATSLVTQPDRIRGALLGLAWGDVLGCPVEGWDARHIRAVYGAYDDLPSAYPARLLRGGGVRLSRLRPLGLHSDDTQQALALLNVCLSPGGWSAERWAVCLVQGMAGGAWRGYGQNFKGAVAHLARGVAPAHAGSRTAGIGAAMRIGPLGALYWDDPATLATVVMESSITTHGDIRAGAIAYAVACAVAGFVAGRSAAAIASALPGAVAAVETGWLQGHPDWQHDRSGGYAVSAGLAVLLSDLTLPAVALRERVSEIARPAWRRVSPAPTLTRATRCSAAATRWRWRCGPASNRKRPWRRSSSKGMIPTPWRPSPAVSWARGFGERVDPDRSVCRSAHAHGLRQRVG